MSLRLCQILVFASIAVLIAPLVWLWFVRFPKPDNNDIEALICVMLLLFTFDGSIDYFKKRAARRRGIF